MTEWGACSQLQGNDRVLTSSRDSKDAPELTGAEAGNDNLPSREGWRLISMTARLVVRMPSGQSHEFPLQERETTIGRGRQCDLVLENS